MLLHQTQKLVVIGNGMAGARVVEEVLHRARLGFDITVIGDERHGNYNRILLSNVLNGSKDPAEIFLNPIDWYAKNGVRLLTGTAATAIDRQQREVVLEDGRRVPYDKLVIATGSRAFVPPIPGTYLKGVFVFRTLDDCANITEWAKGASNVAVIGGGLLGLEAAKGLMTHGPAVHVVEMAPHLMSVQLDAPGGAVLGKAVASLGVTVHCGVTTSQILPTEDGKVRGLRLANGTELPCEMVVISAGIRPNAEIGREAGLAAQRGILVNDWMQTDDPDVYAVG